MLGTSAQVERRVVRLLVEVNVAEALGVEPEHSPRLEGSLGPNVARLAAQVQGTHEDVDVAVREVVLPQDGDGLPNVLCLPPRDERSQVCREGDEGIHLIRDAIKEGYSRGDQPWNR